MRVYCAIFELFSVAVEIPFDKEDLREKISSLGGIVVNKFDLEYILTKSLAKILFQLNIIMLV